MTLKQFMIFAAVARHLSVTRASQELHISQPSVSQHLKLLEEGYKVKLFQKSNRGIVLTGPGNLFLNKITPILTLVDELERVLLTDQKIPRSILWSSVERMVLRHGYCPYSSVFLREATPTSSLCFGQLIGPIWSGLFCPQRSILRC